MPHSTIDTADRGDYVNRYGPTAGRARPTGTQRLKTPTVDIHAHVAVPEAAAYIAPHLVMTDIAMVRHSNAETKSINMTQDADRKVAMVDMDDRLAVLDAMGIDFQVVAPPPFQCYYSVPVEHAVKGSRMVNEGIAGFVAKRPDRFAGLGTVAMQDPAEAVKELEYCMTTLGFKGVEVLTNVHGAELAAPQFAPFWKRAEELGALVMIHPNGFTLA